MEESKLLEDLTLFLLYEWSWREKVTESFYVNRSWKGFDFDALDRLRDTGYITGSHGAKSVFLTEEGFKRGKDLREKILNSLTTLLE